MSTVKIKLALMLGLFVLASALTANAEEWAIYGARPMGMGGAGVAVGDRTTAFYWNPAALALNEKAMLSIGGGMMISAEGNVISEADKIADTIETMGSTWDSLQGKMDNGVPLANDAELQTLLDLFGNKIIGLDKAGQGLLGTVDGGLSIGYKNMGVSGVQLGYFGADPAVDYENLNFNSGGSVNNILPTVGSSPNTPATADGAALATQLMAAGLSAAQANELAYQSEQAGLDVSDPKVQEALSGIAGATANDSTSATQNNSGVYISGISIIEGGFTYAMPLLENKLCVGITLKGMQGETFYNFIRFDEIQGGTDIQADLTSPENTKTTTNFSADLGVLAVPVDWVRIGVTARNVTSPKFDMVGGGDYEVPMQIRAGVAADVLDSLVVAVDYDITNNDTPNLEGYEAQNLGMGLEYSALDFLFLRAGFMKNMSSNASTSMAYTAGVGVNLLLLKLDLGGAVSTEEVEISSSTSGTDGGTTKIREKYGFFFNLFFEF